MSSDLPLHSIHKDINDKDFDVFIAGSGPIGATYARLLVNQGFNVCMVEIGDIRNPKHPGEHQKNEIRFQKDIDKFVRVIQGALSTVSTPTSSTVMPTLAPNAWQAPNDKAIITNGRNPHQELFNNLGAEAVTHCVGGMATHWTCATPEFNEFMERPQIFKNKVDDDDEWRKLYRAARELIGTSETEFNCSIRHNTVLNAIQAHFDEWDVTDRKVKALPLACHRIADGPFVRWHSAENVFGKHLFDTSPASDSHRGVFRLLYNTRCTKLVPDVGNPNKVEIAFAEVQDLIQVMRPGEIHNHNFAIRAKVYVVAAGAVATPQILANSGFGGLRTKTKKQDLMPNVGRYITEQPMAFCQIVLKQDLIEGIEAPGHPEWWKDKVKKHKEKFPKDPLPIPFDDGEPQVTIPFTEKFPWHTQIHRDAFSYGEAGPQSDPRVVVDLRFFGRQDGDIKNRMIFENDVQDMFGMPQPTFEYQPTKKFADEASEMMKDMTDIANVLGGYLPGSSPQFMTPGLALHLGGSVRLGHEENDSVANYNSLVWQIPNLYVAGNGTIPTAFATNPTLTSMALAIRSARVVRDYLKGNQGAIHEITRTPDDWLKWATDSADPDYPDHMTLRTLGNVLGTEVIT